MAAGVLIGRYYIPDDRQLRRTARHSRAYMRALSHLIARDHDTVVNELRMVVEENVDDVEPYFALGAMFRSRGEYERAIRVFFDEVHTLLERIHRWKQRTRFAMRSLVRDQFGPDEHAQLIAWLVGLVR
jgi:lipopolysaccharide biosynthesis regulator YciM